MGNDKTKKEISFMEILREIKPRYLVGTVTDSINKTDLLNYAEHLAKVKNAKSLIDNKAPALNSARLLSSWKFTTDFYDYSKIAKANFDLVRRINTIQRSPMTVTVKTVPKKHLGSKWIEYTAQLKKIEIENKQLYTKLMKKGPTMKTSELKETWNRNLFVIKKNCKLPYVLGIPDPDELLKSTPSISRNLDKTLLSPQIRPKIFMEIKIKTGHCGGKLFFELYNDIVPHSVAYFLRFCNEATEVNYKNANFYRIYRNSHCEIGEMEQRLRKNQLYNFEFSQENFLLRHNRPGVLSLVRTSEGKNNCQFSITFGAKPEFNKKRVAIGKLIKGAKTLQFLNDMARKVGCFVNGTPLERTYISAIGVVPQKVPTRMVNAFTGGLNPCGCPGFSEKIQHPHAIR